MMSEPSKEFHLRGERCIVMTKSRCPLKPAQTRKDIMKATVLLILMLCMATFSMAETSGVELREWTDRDGNTVKAEYVRTEVESVILRGEDGTEFKVSMQSLSETDLQFVRLQTPPRIFINMEPSVDSYTVGYLGNGGYDYTVRYQVVEPSVLLRKTSTEPYEAPLEMEVILLGRIREVRRYIVIDNAVVSFKFTGKQSYEVNYIGYPVDLRQIRGSWRSGIEYEGYLVLIRDSMGRLVAVKSNKISLEQNAEGLSGAQTGSMLTDKWKVIKPRIVMPDDGYEQPKLTF